MYSWIVQWTDEIPTNAPYGEDITFSEDFDAIRLEVDKATSIHAEAPTDWGEVLERCSAMLAETSKDLWLFWYGCRAAFEVYGSAGLSAALETCANYLEDHWQGLFPPVTKLARRAAPFAWFITHMESILDREFLNTLPENECRSLRASFERVQTLIDKELDEQAPSFRLFIRALPEPEPGPTETTPPNASHASSFLDSPDSSGSSGSSGSTGSTGSLNSSAPHASHGQKEQKAPKGTTSTAKGISKSASKNAKSKAGTAKTATKTISTQRAKRQKSDGQVSANDGDAQQTSNDQSGEGPLSDTQLGANLDTKATSTETAHRGDKATEQQTDKRTRATGDSTSASDKSHSQRRDQNSLADNSISPVHRESTREREMPSAASATPMAPVAPLFPQNVPTMSEASLTQLIRNTTEQTRQLAGYFLALNPLDWKAYMLHRAVLWGSIIQLPDATHEGLTQIRPPSKERLQEYSSAILNSQYAGILIALGKTTSHAPFWLDGHGMVIKCLNALQAPMAAKVMTACLRCFIDKFPQLLGYQFFDGTPFASQETHDWLNSLDARPKSAVPALMPLTPERGASSDREKIAEALDVVKEKGFHEGFRCFDSLPLSKSRQGFLNALTKINFCLMAGKPEAALTLATVTYKQLEDWGMVEWEPELSAQLLGLIIKSPGLPADKRNELYQKLHWLHMETALGLMPE